VVRAYEYTRPGHVTVTGGNCELYSQSVVESEERRSGVVCGMILKDSD